MGVVSVVATDIAPFTTTAVSGAIRIDVGTDSATVVSIAVTKYGY